MRTHLYVSLLVASLTLGSAVDASGDSRGLAVTEARSTERCADLIKECFAYDTNEKSSCFQVSSKHPFCVDSELGMLAGKRWTMSPETDFRESSPALTGPRFINGECVANFDSQWSGHLIGGTLSREVIRQLDGVLDSCAKAPANEIFRP
ncbi:MAG: hypothetical protein RL417_2088 [Pseudomonadota bacterium]|jgi:hypothetical protein